MNTEQINKINLQKALATIDKVKSLTWALAMNREDKEIYAILNELEKFEIGMERTLEKYNREHV